MIVRTRPVMGMRAPDAHRTVQTWSVARILFVAAVAENAAMARNAGMDGAFVYQIPLPPVTTGMCIALIPVEIQGKSLPTVSMAVLTVNARAAHSTVVDENVALILFAVRAVDSAMKGKTATRMVSAAYGVSWVKASVRKMDMDLRSAVRTLTIIQATPLEPVFPVLLEKHVWKTATAANEANV